MPAEPLPTGPRRCRTSLPIRLIRPVISCFLEPESTNLNYLVLISFRLARDERKRFTGTEKLPKFCCFGLEPLGAERPNEPTRGRIPRSGSSFGVRYLRTLLRAHRSMAAAH
jgi:hypothetical protein